jgi:hypothetical protein
LPLEYLQQHFPDTVRQHKSAFFLPLFSTNSHLLAPISFDTSGTVTSQHLDCAVRQTPYHRSAIAPPTTGIADTACRTFAGAVREGWVFGVDTISSLRTTRNNAQPFGSGLTTFTAGTSCGSQYFKARNLRHEPFMSQLVP